LPGKSAEESASRGRSLFRGKGKVVVGVPCLRGSLTTLFSAPSPRRRGGKALVFSPLSASGRGLGGGVSRRPLRCHPDTSRFLLRAVSLLRPRRVEGGRFSLSLLR